MSRLTKKTELGDYIFIDGEMVCPNEIATKLGKLEDIEDELGCPLDVVFKALKEGISLEDKEWLIVEHLTFQTNKQLHCRRAGQTREIYLSLKDYKKTWWLCSDKEDLSE